MGKRRGGKDSLRKSPAIDGSVAGAKITALDPAKQLSVVRAEIKRAVKEQIRSLNTPAGQWLGPQQPLQPVAPDDYSIRTWDYPGGYNTGFTPRKYEPYSFQQLQWLADNFDLLREVIERRKGEIVQLKFDIVPREGSSCPQGAIDEIKDFLRFPDGNRLHPWAVWLRMLLEDMLVLDAATVYPHLTLNGGIYAFDVVSGATILPLVDETGRFPSPPDPAFQQIIKGLPAVDFTMDELIYYPKNIRPYSPVYGYSPVQQLVMTVTIGLKMELRDAYFFTEGTIPDALASVPDSWSGRQLAQFQSWFDSTMKGDLKKRSGGLRFVPGGMKAIAMKEYGIKKEQWEWIARMVCAAFHVSPQPYVSQVNRATAETALVEQTEEGLEPDKAWLKGLVDLMLEHYLKHPELELVYNDDKGVDIVEQATADKSDISIGKRTINEIRARDGVDPVEGGDDPIIITGSGITRVKDLEMQAQQAQQAQAGAQAQIDAMNNPPEPKQTPDQAQQSSDDKVSKAYGKKKPFNRQTGNQTPSRSRLKQSSKLL